MKCKLMSFTTGFVIAIGLYVVDYILDAELRAVQAGEVRLVCFMKSGEQVIKPSQVVGLMDGTWLFENGYARNCKVIK